MWKGSASSRRSGGPAGSSGSGGRRPRLRRSVSASRGTCRRRSSRSASRKPRPRRCSRTCRASRGGSAARSIEAQTVEHRGPTLGYRIEDEGRVLAYLPDHEPYLTAALDDEPEWISGWALAAGADLLLHDSQYTEDEYPSRLGWGHSSVAHAATFARAAGVRQLAMFHHDPMRSDRELEALYDRGRRDRSRRSGTAADRPRGPGDRALLEAPAWSEAEPARTLENMQICPGCGEENPDKFRVCGFCGTALAAAEPQPAEPQRPSVRRVAKRIRPSSGSAASAGVPSPPRRRPARSGRSSRRSSSTSSARPLAPRISIPRT